MRALGALAAWLHLAAAGGPAYSLGAHGRRLQEGEDVMTADQENTEEKEVEDAAKDTGPQAENWGDQDGEEERSPVVNAIVLFMITTAVGYRYYRMHRAREGDHGDEGGVRGLMAALGIADRDDPPATQGMRVVHVVLPADAEVGQTRQLVAEPSGEIVEIQVPHGRGPGDILAVEIPAGPEVRPSQFGRSSTGGEELGDFGSGGVRQRVTRGPSPGAAPPAPLRRANSMVERGVSVLAPTGDGEGRTDEEWCWLIVIWCCTLWLAVLTPILIFAGRAQRT